MTGSGAVGPDLGTFVRQRSPMAPQPAALFAADLADRLVEVHEAATAHGPLDTGVRVETTGGRPRPVILSSGISTGQYSEADDVRAVCTTLADLLGAVTPTVGLPWRPAAVPESLWSVIVPGLASDPAARPAMTLLARQLHDAARDLLLGVSPWPAPPAADRPPEPDHGATAEIGRSVPLQAPGTASAPPATVVEPGAPARARVGTVVAVAAGALVLAAIGVGGLVHVLSGRGPAAGTAAAATQGATPPATGADVLSPGTMPSTSITDSTAAAATPSAPVTGRPVPSAPGPPAPPPRQTGGQPAKPKPPPGPSGGSNLDISTSYARATGSVSWNGSGASSHGTISDGTGTSSHSWVRIAYRVNTGGVWKLHYASPDPYLTVTNGQSRSFSWSVGGPVEDVQWDLCSKPSGKSYCTGWH